MERPTEKFCASLDLGFASCLPYANLYHRLISPRLQSNGGPSLPFYSAQLPDPLEDIPPITSHRVTAPALNPEQQVFRFTNLKVCT
jgi:hypothetical protein